MELYMFDVAAESIELMGKKSHFDYSSTTSTAKPVTWVLIQGRRQILDSEWLDFIHVMSINQSQIQIK